MGMTMAEKIISAHTGDQVFVGSIVRARVDLAFANDITGPVAVEEFRRMGAKRVFDPSRVALIPDHFVPSKDIPSARQAKVIRDFASEQGIEHYFEVGRMGIEHSLLPDEGLVLPGDLVVGADSHTCTLGAVGAFATGLGSTDVAMAWALGEVWLKVPPTLRVDLVGAMPRWVSAKDVILHLIGSIGVEGALYRAIEFGGEGLGQIDMDGRFTLCNMAVEAGAKAGMVPPDGITLEYLGPRAKRPLSPILPDEDAEYERRLVVDLSGLEPLVACPHLPSNVRPVSELRGIRIDQVVIGSCTNGRLSDLRAAAEVLRGKRVAPWVRLIVIPATQGIYLSALREGLLEVFLDAGAAVSTPTCGPCLGGHMGVLAEGERAVSTTNRNFVGRMGHPSSEVYLAGPAVAAASAVEGFIADPREVVGG